MTSVSKHREKIAESVEEINAAIDRGIEKRPQTIAFHASAAAMNLLELYLHCLNKITAGKQVKHNWFKRPQDGQKRNPLAETKISCTFPHREAIFNLIYEIEDNRDSLIYGKSDAAQLKALTVAFQKLRKIIEAEIKRLGETVEV